MLNHPLLQGNQISESGAHSLCMRAKVGICKAQCSVIADTATKQPALEGIPDIGVQKSYILLNFGNFKIRFQTYFISPWYIF